MKFTLLLCLCCALFSSTHAQTLIRKAGENKDSLVARTLNEKSYAAGVYEFSNDTASIILYAKVCSTKAITKEPDYRDTWTLLNILYSTDHIHYTNYVIDTIGQSNSCWAPMQLDSLLMFNIDADQSDELCLVLYRVPYCDAYLTTIHVLFFDNWESFLPSKELKQLSNINFEIFELPPPTKAQLPEKIAASLRESGVLK